jgi:hypothetical protein
MDKKTLEKEELRSQMRTNMFLHPPNIVILNRWND